MNKLSDKARMYARSYRHPPYNREIEGTAELLLQMAEKLEEYEDIGTVEDFKKALENVRTLSGMYEKLSDQEVAEYHKLAEYEDLEEQGKLLKLPCAVGDTVYVLHIDNAEYMINGKKIWEIVEERFEMRHFDCMGKTVFLTREEAEAALKEL